MRSDIISAAADLFSERGFTNVSMKEIAARAGFNEATVFRKFGSKKKLAAAVVDRELKNALPMIGHDVIARANFKEMAPIYASWLEQRLTTRFVRLYAAMSIELPDIVSLKKRPEFEAMVQVVARLLKKGRPGIESDPVWVVKILHAAIFGLAMLRGVSSRSQEMTAEKMHASIKAITQCWMRAVTGDAL